MRISTHCRRKESEVIKSKLNSPILKLLTLNKNTHLRSQNISTFQKKLEMHYFKINLLKLGIVSLMNWQHIVFKNDLDNFLKINRIFSSCYFL